MEDEPDKRAGTVSKTDRAGNGLGSMPSIFRQFRTRVTTAGLPACRAGASGGSTRRVRHFSSPRRRSSRVASLSQTRKPVQVRSRAQVSSGTRKKANPPALGAGYTRSVTGVPDHIKSAPVMFNSPACRSSKAVVRVQLPVGAPVSAPVARTDQAPVF